MKTTIQILISLSISYASHGQKEFSSRAEAISYMELNITEILPWNWSLVKTDTSITVYFARTATGENKATHLIVQDSSSFGSEFYHQAMPDSIFTTKAPSLGRCNFPKLDTTGFVNQTPNNVLMIKIVLDSVGNQYSFSQSYNYYVTITPSVSCTEDVYYKEQLTPSNPYYNNEYGKELRREYLNLWKVSGHVMGFNNTSRSLKGN